LPDRIILTDQQKQEAIDAIRGGEHVVDEFIIQHKDRAAADKED
jgi:VCBS repeat-containing protein